MQNILSNSYWLESTNKLGGVYPYYNLEEPDSFTLDFSEILSSRKASNLAIELDETALVTKMCIPFLIGDRTLIQGVSKTPWVSNYKGKGRWVPHYLPPHGNLIPEKNAFTIKFKEALLAEARDYIEGKKNIGILLSGGMDSRILAGVIRELQLTDRPELLTRLLNVLSN